MTSWLNHWSLALVTFLPLAGALIMMLVPAKEEVTQKAVAVGTSLATLAVGIWIAAEVEDGGAQGGPPPVLLHKNRVKVINNPVLNGDHRASPPPVLPTPR